jgi:hypothetical protein
VLPVILALAGFGLNPWRQSSSVAVAGGLKKGFIQPDANLRGGWPFEDFVTRKSRYSSRRFRPQQPDLNSDRLAPS